MLNVSVTEILRVLSRGIYIMTNGLAIFGLFEKKKKYKIFWGPFKPQPAPPVRPRNCIFLILNNKNNKKFIVNPIKITIIVSFTPFWFLVTLGDEVIKIWKYYVIFVYILQGKMGKTEKTGRKSRN